MPAPATPNHKRIEPYYLAVRERDAHLAGAATALQVKIARANLLPASLSETGHRRQSQKNVRESGQENEAFHHCSDFSVLRLSTKRMAIGRPATASPMPSLKCNGVQRASAALTASR